jgi:hypothetical protein
MGTPEIKKKRGPGTGKAQVAPKKRKEGQARETQGKENSDVHRPRASGSEGT